MTSAWNALVLNADHRPVTRFPLSVWSFERTMRAVLKERVDILEDYGVELHSPSLIYRPPSVVVLKTYVKRPQRVPFTRMNVFLRDQFTCQYCGKPFEAHELTFEHVVPRSAGGGVNWENICAACVPCNQRKANRRDMKPMRPPREPSIGEMTKLRRLRSESFHDSWLDYLYWSGALDRDS